MRDGGAYNEGKCVESGVLGRRARVSTAIGMFILAVRLHRRCCRKFNSLFHCRCCKKMKRVERRDDGRTDACRTCRARSTAGGQFTWTPMSGKHSDRPSPPHRQETMTVTDTWNDLDLAQTFILVVRLPTLEMAMRTAYTRRRLVAGRASPITSARFPFESLSF